MSRFSGNYRNIPKRRVNAQGKPYGPRGVLRAHRDIKREDAEARNAVTPHANRRVHARGLCKSIWGGCPA